MNLIDLKTWAQDVYAKDNRQLMDSGVKEKSLAKIRPHLKGIIERCDIVNSTTKKNNELMADIEKFLKYLSEWGLPMKEAKSESKEEIPTGEKADWYSKRNK